MIKFLDLKKQYFSIKEEIDSAIFKVLEDTSFIGGDCVNEFETNFAKYCNSTHCISVGNGTDALEIALWALKLPQESEVIVPANSFIATSEAVSRNNLKVKFVDCDEYYQMCPKSLKEKITKNTSAIVVVHLYGHPANMHEIMEIADEYSLKLIEDCAQSHGAKFDGKSIGTFGDLATFSFYPGKNLGAYGDGGAIITNIKELAINCRKYSNHGRSSKYGHEFEGRNSRLDTLQAAILCVKLKYLDTWIKKRQLVAKQYLESINNSLVKLPFIHKDAFPVWHLFVVQVDRRDFFMRYLKEQGIQCGIHYPVALPKLETYSYLKENYSLFKACNEDSNLVSIPIGEHLEDHEVKKVIEVINSFKY